MTRNILLIGVNLLIAAAIGGNAVFALLSGCDFGGRCSGNSNALTWALAIGLPLLVVGGIAAMAVVWLRARPNSDEQIITISGPGPAEPATEAQASGDTVATQAMIDDAMAARLARTASAAHVAHIAPPSPDNGWASDSTDNADTDDSADTDADADALQDMADPMPVMSAEVPYTSTGWSLDKSTDDDVTVADQPVDPAAGYRPTVSAFPSFADFSAEDIVADEDDEEAPARSIAWLVDTESLEPAPQLLLSSGFPWTVAGIDQVCVAMARLGTALAGSDYPSEAAAWRQVVDGLPRAQPLAMEDAKHFTLWLNAMLCITDVEGLDMVEDALHELAVEAATNAALSAVLPGEVVSPWDRVRAQDMLRRLK